MLKERMIVLSSPRCDEARNNTRVTLPDPDAERPEARGARPPTPRASSGDFFALTIAAFQVLWKPVGILLSGFFIAYVVGWVWFGGGAAWLWQLVTGGGA